MADTHTYPITVGPSSHSKQHFGSTVLRVGGTPFSRRARRRAMGTPQIRTSFSLNLVAKRAAPQQHDTAATAESQQADSEKANKIPKIKHLLGAQGLPKGVSHETLKKIAMNKLMACDRMIAIDVETHDMVPKGSLPTWLPDQFGLRTRNTPEAMSSLRIVQLGWADGAINENGHATNILVKPDGFEITPDAANLHGITQEMASTKGVPLQEALQTMVGEVLDQCAKGACLVSHNLPFDAGLIYEELGRAGLGGLKTAWEQAARNGIDTMDPDIAYWARKRIGCENKDWIAPTGLKDLVSGYVPGAAGLLRNHHNADADASMHLALCRELVKAYTSERG